MVQIQIPSKFNKLASSSYCFFLHPRVFGFCFVVVYVLILWHLVVGFCDTCGTYFSWCFVSYLLLHIDWDLVSYLVFRLGNWLVTSALNGHNDKNSHKYGYRIG
jgi:hypothetical protein